MDPGTNVSMQRHSSRRPAVVRIFLMLLGIMALGSGMACAGTTRAGIVEVSALHPMAVPADPFLSALSGGLEGPKPAAERAGDSPKAGASAAPTQSDGSHPVASGAPVAGSVSASTGVVAASATAPSMVPAVGEARSEMVSSSVRLLGISGSFNDRSFLGHVLRVNDLLPTGASAQSFPSSEELRLAKAAGALRTVDTARSGDVVFFQCPSGCGAMSADGVAAGIVESATGGAVRLITYVDGAVKRCTAGQGGVGGGIRIDHAIGVADPWVLRTSR